MMERAEINAIARVLSRVETSEGGRFKEALKENSFLQLERFEDGALVVYKEDEEYNIICSFGHIMRDVQTAQKVERIVNAYLKKLGDGECVNFVHGGDQIYLNNFVCNLNFQRPHYGLEYRLKRDDFLKVEDRGLLGMEASPYRYDRAEDMYRLHYGAFIEQNSREGHPEGYTPERKAELIKRFGTPSEDGSAPRVYTLDGHLIGYTVFEDNYCDTLALDPAYQHKGYGRAMLYDSIRQAFANPKIRAVTLHTFLINLNAQRLYESLGFKRVGFFCANDSKKKDELRFPAVLGF